MTRADLISCGIEAVKQMLRDRGYTWQNYAGGWAIRGPRFALVTQHPERITARDLDRPWIDEDDCDEREEIEINGARFYV